MNRPTGVVEPDAYGKIDGEDVTDSVMFKFFITYLDELSDGETEVQVIIPLYMVTCGDFGLIAGKGLKL